MTDGHDQAMVDAGLNLLRADAGLVVFDGFVPNPTPALPYVLVYTTVDWPEDDPNHDALDNRSTHAVVRWICHCVGGDQITSRAVAQRVRTQLLNVRPAVAGMQPGLIKQETPALPPTRDERTGSVVFDSVRVFRLTVDS